METVTGTNYSLWATNDVDIFYYFTFFSRRGDFFIVDRGLLN